MNKKNEWEKWLKNSIIYYILSFTVKKSIRKMTQKKNWLRIILYYNTIYYPLQSKIIKSSILPSILNQFQIKDSES